MANPADTLAAAQAAIAAASVLVTASQALVDNAHDQLTAVPPTLTLDQYRALVNHHAAVIGNAAIIRQLAALDLGSTIKQDTEALLRATSDLKDRLAALAHVQDVVDRASQVLVAAGALATLGAAPSLMTAGAFVTAVEAIGG